MNSHKYVTDFRLVKYNPQRNCVRDFKSLPDFQTGLHFSMRVFRRKLCSEYHNNTFCTVIYTVYRYLNNYIYEMHKCLTIGLSVRPVKQNSTMVEHGQNNKIRVCYRKQIRAYIILLIHLSQHSPQRTILNIFYTILLIEKIISNVIKAKNYNSTSITYAQKLRFS